MRISDWSSYVCSSDLTPARFAARRPCLPLMWRSQRPLVTTRNRTMSAHALHKLRNIVHSALLIAGMALIVSACAWTLWGTEGILWGLAGALLAMLLSPAVPPAPALSPSRTRPPPRNTPLLEQHAP